MKNTTLIFIRHGEIDNPGGVFYGGSLDLALSNGGKTQIAHVGELLKQRGYFPSAVYASGLSRAIDSARTLLGAMGSTAKLTIDERLNDNKIPLFAGLTHEEKEKKYPGKDEYDETLKGHETREEVVDRMQAVLRDVLKSHEGQTVCIVGHGDPLRFIVYALSSPGFKKLPPMAELADHDYLNKGEALRVVLDYTNTVVEKELISPPRIKREKGY